MMYYVAKVKVVVSDSNTGKQKTTTEQYLVNAVSVTDVEAKIHEEFKDSILDYDVSSVSETKILKVIQ